MRLHLITTAIAALAVTTASAQDGKPRAAGKPQSKAARQTPAPSQQLPVTSSGSIVPAYVLSTPEKCWVEDGYNRWYPCTGGPP
jgi:hypothetical protein